MIKSIYFFIFLLGFNVFSFAQTKVNQYEIEILESASKDNKDTREINSVIVFEKDQFVIKSRRKKNLVFKNIKYEDIVSIEHTFAKKPFIRDTKRAIIATLITANPVLLMEDKPKHWLTIISKDNFAVIKMENDNFRLIKAEFIIRKFNIETTEEK
jgi:hypothetical protein